MHCQYLLIFHSPTMPPYFNESLLYSFPALMNRTNLITDVQEAQSAMATILNESKVGLDLEGMDLGVDGKVSLVSLALQNGKIFIFDVYSCPLIMFDGKLHEVLESDRILKVTLMTVC